MEPIQIIFQILSAIILVIAIFQKSKWKMMLVYTVNNIILAVMYFAFARITTAIISIIAAVRTIIFMIYALKNIKPNFVWLIIFETAFILCTILTWQDALDLLPLFALLTSCYGSWQNNQSVLRICYAINAILCIVYKIFIGAYISMAIEVLNLICTIISFIYYCLLKKETPILEAIFNKNKTKNKIDTNNPEK